MKERIVIIFIAVTLGLLATTIAFFVYETAKPNKTIEAPTQKAEQAAPKNLVNLTVTAPLDESVTSKRTIEVKGKTDPQNTVIISSNQDDVAAVPTSTGDFTATISIEDDVNQIKIKSITPDGNSIEDVRTVSFSTDSL